MQQIIFCVVFTSFVLSREFQYSENYIWVGPEQVDWYTANTICQSEFGTTLASIHTSIQDAEIDTLCQSYASSTGRCFIGLIDQNTEGQYVWIDDTSVDFLGWGGAEPQNNIHGSEDEDCSAIDNQAAYWIDLPCSWAYTFICNKPDYNCEENSEIKHINWNELQNSVNNLNQIPYSNFSIYFNEITLELTFNIDLEYIGLSSDGNFDLEYNLGTTYVIGFDSFATSENKINEPGNCENRILD
eukprot:149799_1